MSDIARCDRRVTHTKKLIRNAVIELLKEKPLSRITITELCKKADINRNTFYCHYNFPEDVVAEIENEFLIKFRDVFEPHHSDENDSNIILNTCRIFEQEKEMAYVVFRDVEGTFMKRLIDLAHEKNIYDWKAIGKYTDEKTAENFYTFTLAGATSIIRNWCNNGFKETAEEISELVIKLSLYGMKGFIGD